MLDHLALLIVQEHEVVALLPRKSSPNPAANAYTCYVTSDSSGSESSDDAADDDYSVSDDSDEGLVHSRRMAGATLMVTANPRNKNKQEHATITQVALVPEADLSTEEDHGTSIFDFLQNNV